MSVIDDINALAPEHYKIIRVAFQWDNGDIRATWDVCIMNAQGCPLATLHLDNQPDVDLRAALVSWYQDCVAWFESVTGLTECN